MNVPFSASPSDSLTDTPIRLLYDLIPLTTVQFLQLAPQIAAVVAALHQSGKLHQAICPQAFGLTPAGKIVLIEPVAPIHNQRTLMRFAYLAPEQTGRLNQPVDQRSDLYALGITFYQLLAGRLPFTATDPLEWVHCHIARMPLALEQAVPGIPSLVAAIVMRLLAKAAEDRYQSAEGLQADLERCRDQWTANGHIDDFVLGTADHSDRFALPERLYGREYEIDTLAGLVETTTLHAAHTIVLVTGNAGIGKTALVHQLQPLIVQHNGFFLYGAFDPRNQAVPYAALAQALRELIEQLLTASEERLGLWRHNIQAALGESGQALLNLVPDLALIIGSQPPLAELGPSESQHRLALLFQRFIQTLARSETPLALVLDNAQWADPPTLTLLQSLAFDTGRAHLLLALVYRDTELADTIPLVRWLAEIETAGIRATEIMLEPLNQAAMSQLVADTTPMPPPSASKLAQEIVAKSGGIPLLARELLALLYQEQKLTFDRTAGSWHWNEAAVAAHTLSNDPSALLLSRLQRLPTATTALLRVAACVGTHFDLALMSAALHTTESDALDNLRPAIESRLISPVESALWLAEEGQNRHAHSSYRWRQDQIRLAVYAQLDAGEQHTIHQAIGRYLLLQPAELRDPFAVVAQYTRVDDLPTDATERTTLALVAEEAGRRARASNAYASACAAFDLAAALLPNDTEAIHHQQNFELLFARAESTYMAGEFAAAEEQFANLLAACTSNLSRARIYDIRLKLYQVAGRYSDGVTLATEALAMFGVSVPTRGDDLQAEMAAELAAIPVNMSGRAIADLLDAPLVEDPYHRAIINLLANLAPCAYIGRPEIFPVIGLRLLNASLRYGNTPASCFAYSVYALMLVSVFGDIPAGYEFSVMSLKLNERLNDITLRGTLLHLHGDHINFWRNPIASDIPILEQAFAACLEAGDLVYSGFVAFEIVWQFLERGDALATLAASAAPYLAFARQARNEPVADTIQLQLQFAQALQGGTRSNNTLDNNEFDTEACMARITAASFGCGIVFYHIIRLLLDYSFGRYQAALAAANQAVPVLGAAMAMPIEATYTFYRALTLTALLRDPECSNQTALRSDLEQQQARLMLWATHSPANFQYAAHLVAAEIAALEGCDIEAMHLYDQAREAARASGFTHYAALASECAARYYRALNLPTPAAAYLYQARTDYLAWGATAKVAYLDTIYPLPTEPKLSSPSLAPTETQLTAPNEPTLNQQFDLRSVLKASQALSSEIVLDNLLHSLLRIVLEHTGGMRAALLLEDADQMLLVAEAYVLANDIHVTQPQQPISADTDRLPFALLSYVRRKREPLVLNNATHHTLFSTDTYVRRIGLRSVLCMPMLRHATLMGILYLEHPQISGVFTHDRLSVLEILLTQAAISLENARLYASIQNENAERLRAEQERQELQDQVIIAQQMALRELSTPLMPIAEGVVAMPIIGSIDTARAQQIMETLLEGISTQSADIAILDITGVKVVDTQIAGALIKAAQAARLLGAEVILSGIGPEVAQMLVHIGADLRDMIPKRSLRQGIAYALARRKYSNPL